jgi:hypothetical protein
MSEDIAIEKMAPRKHRGAIYLSGGMQFSKDLGESWRLHASRELVAMGYVPLDITAMDKAYSAKHGHVNYKDIMDSSPTTRKHWLSKSVIRKHFIHADLELIRNEADAVIVYYDESVQRGAGTLGECQFTYLLNKPLFLVSAFTQGHIPGWLQGLATHCFLDFESLYHYMQKLPFGILRKDIYGNHGVDGKYLCNMCGAVFKKNPPTFVSKVEPLLCKTCVDVVAETHQEYDRYTFMKEYLEKEYALY